MYEQKLSPIRNMMVNAMDQVNHIQQPNYTCCQNDCACNRNSSTTNSLRRVQRKVSLPPTMRNSVMISDAELPMETVIDRSNETTCTKAATMPTRYATATLELKHSQPCMERNCMNHQEMRV